MKTPKIRVLPFGLGPIGAAVARQIAERPGFKIVGAIDIDPAKVGRDVGDVIGLTRRLGSKVQRGRGQGPARRQARRRRAVHELVGRGGDAADRDHPQGEDADRVDDRGAVVSRLHTCPAGAADSPVGEEGEGRRARDRRQSRVRDGRAADRADGGVRAGRPRRGQPRAGCAHPPAAVSAEDRRRTHDRAVPAEGRRWQRAPRRAHRIDRDDRRRARAGRSIGSPTTSSRSSPR